MPEEVKEIPTNYTRGYAVTRGWGDWEIVREFAQNALDAAGAVSIGKVAEGLEITDRGRGFNAINLLMGTTKKSPCDRGRFGEGMKIACLAALNRGYSVEIMTDSMQITPVFKVLEIEEPGGEITKAEIMVFRYWKIPSVGGTHILVKGYRGDAYIYRFNIGQKKTVFKSEIDECEGKKYLSSMIDEPHKCIYVRNIYVQDIKEKALYSYDLFNVQLSTDRNIPSEYTVLNQIGTLWSIVADVGLLETFFRHIKADGYEAKANLSDYIISKHSASSWKRAFQNVFGNNSFISTGEDTTRIAEYHYKFMKKGISLPYGIKSALVEIVDTDSSLLKNLASKMPRSPGVLDTIQQANIEYLKMIHYKLKEKYFPKLTKVFIGSEESMVDIRGKVHGGNIYIRDDQTDSMVNLLDVYGHEATHIIFPELEDNTSEFYGKIGVVMATITKAVMIESIKQPKGIKW